MGKTNENEILRRLEAVSQVKPSAEVTAADIERVRRSLTEQGKRQATKKQAWRTVLTSRIAKLSAAAAVVLIVSAIFLHGLNGTSTWAAVIKAFDEVSNVHISYKLTSPVETGWRLELYLKRPDHLYDESQTWIVIDNGTERLRIDKEKKTAQFSDSFIPYDPLKEHYVFEDILMFRSESNREIELTQLAEESDDITLVFGFHVKSKSSDLELEGKAWVEAATMLPLKMQIEQVMGSPEYAEVTGTLVFDYGPIPDEVFVMEVPEGYQELPRKQPGTVSGKVVDENGQPAAYAQVYIADKMGMFAEGAQTGADGSFMFKMPPVGSKSWMSLPLILRAFYETDPDRVAWTIIATPGSEDDGTMPVPGEIGRIVNDGYRLKEASGVILKMEPAARIHGQVTDGEGNPVPGAWVSVRGYPADKWGNQDHSMFVFTFAGPGERGTVQTQTDEHGRYEFHNLPRLWKESSYHFKAGADGFVNGESRFITKGKRNISGIDLQLYKAGITVRGVLVDNYGEPLAGRYIYPVVAEEVFRSCQTVTDERGRFQVDGCPVSKDLKIKAMLQHRVVSPYSQEKISEYVYYPDAFVGIDFEPDKTIYEIKLVAARPELVLNVEVKNTAGQVLQYYPVEIRGDAGTISRAWKVENKLERRTDVNGRCRFTEVPNVNGLKIVLYAGNKIPNEQLSGEAKRIAEQHEKEYFWGEAPVEVAAGQKEYDIEAIALTEKEHSNRKRRKK